MIKTANPTDWFPGQRIVTPIKWGSRGLTGYDKQAFIKEAGHAFEPQLDKIVIAADEHPIHLLGVSDYYTYGLNRNGDGFEKQTCESHHPTFVKLAKWYRGHKNKPEQGHPHFGRIAASVYNPEMERIELIAALNTNKAACDRNGGFVADKELEKIAKGEDIPVSMAAKVPQDVCTFCGQKAATRKDYCTSATCKAGGGKDNLTRIVKVAGDLHHLGRLNPVATWFDMSAVFRPADPMAWGTTADYLQKSAEYADEFTDKVAEEIGYSRDVAPLDVLLYSLQDDRVDTGIAQQVKLAYALNILQKQEQGRIPEFLKKAFCYDNGMLKTAFHGRSLEKQEKLAALADYKIVLSLRDYFSIFPAGIEAEKLASAIPEMYDNLLCDPDLVKKLRNGMAKHAHVPQAQKTTAFGNESYWRYSCDPAAVERRVILKSAETFPALNLKTSFEKCALDTQGLIAIQDYVIYQLNALNKIAAFDNKFSQTARNVVRQNLIY